MRDDAEKRNRMEIRPMGLRGLGIKWYVGEPQDHLPAPVLSPVTG